MNELCNFKFISETNIDGEKDIIEFDAKGYKSVVDNKIILYFKNEFKYKFIIGDDKVEVNVDDSKYYFVKNKKTEALIKQQGYELKTSILTSNLKISKEQIIIEYIMDFIDFQGHYKITLMLY